MKLAHVWSWTCINISGGHAEKESASEKVGKAISRWCANRVFIAHLVCGCSRLRKYGDPNNRNQASLQGPKCMSSVTQDSFLVPCAWNCSHTAPFCHFLFLIPVTSQVWLGGLFSFKKWLLEAETMNTYSTWYIFFPSTSPYIQLTGSSSFIVRCSFNCILSGDRRQGKRWGQGS